MATSSCGLRCSKLAATEMPAAPPPTITTSWLASAWLLGVLPPLAMRCTKAFMSKPTLFDASKICGKGVTPACDKAHMVVERMPVRQ